MRIVIPSQTLRIDTFAICDDFGELLNYSKRTRKPLREGWSSGLRQVARSMLAYTQFIDQHLAVRLLKTTVMACCGDRAVDLVICLDNRLGIPTSNGGAKGREAFTDRDEIAIGPADRRKVPDDRLEYVHRFVVIDDVDKLECSDSGTAVRLKLDQSFRSESNQRFTHRSTRDLVLAAQSLLLKPDARFDFERNDRVTERRVDSPADEVIE